MGSFRKPFFTGLKVETCKKNLLSLCSPVFPLKRGLNNKLKKGLNNKDRKPYKNDLGVVFLPSVQPLRRPAVLPVQDEDTHAEARTMLPPSGTCSKKGRAIPQQRSIFLFSGLNLSRPEGLRKGASGLKKSFKQP